MQNKIRSAIGGLAMLASAAVGQVATNAPAITSFNYIAPDKTYTNGSFRIEGVVYKGDTNNYSVIWNSDLLNSNNWQETSLNSGNVHTNSFFEKLGLNTPVSVRVPKNPDMPVNHTKIFFGFGQPTYKPGEN